MLAFGLLCVVIVMGMASMVLATGNDVRRENEQADRNRN